MDGPDDLAERFEVKAQVAAPGKGKKGGKTKDNAGAGAGAGGAQKKEKDISRALSRLLRHQATNAGITLDAEGYAPLEKVVSVILWKEGSDGRQDGGVDGLVASLL